MAQIHPKKQDKHEIIGLNKKPTTFSYKWDDDNSNFTPIAESYTNLLSSEELSTFQAIVEDIYKHSGIKKPVVIVETIIFLAVIVGGYIGAYFLIKGGYQAWGGTIIFLSSLLVFFLFMGYKAIQGTQLERITAYLSKNSNSFTEKVKGLNYQFLYSFNNGKF